MKNTHLIAGVIGIIIIIAFIALFGSGGRQGEGVTAALATTLAPNMTRLAATIGELSTISSSTTVYTGDTLATSHTGRGIIEEKNGTATLIDYDTTLTFAESEEGTRVSLITGNMWARVKRSFGQGEYYEIKTQNAVAVVRGTSFGVFYKDHLSTLQVAEGTVALAPRSFITGEAVKEKEVLVEKGFGATVDDEGKVTVFKLTAVQTQGNWYLFNNPLNGILPTGFSPLHNTIETVTETLVHTTVGTIEVTTGITETAASTLTLRSVRPTSVTQGDLLTLHGTGFLKVTTIYYGPTKLVPGDYDIVSDTVIEIHTLSIPAGIYSLNLIDSRGGVATLTTGFTVTVPTPTTTIFLPRTY